MKPRPIPLARIAALALVYLASSSAVRAQQPVPTLGANPTTSAASADASTAENYRLSTNDLVYVKVFEEDDLNSTLRISEDGQVIFPLVGTVKIGGLSVHAASQKIQALLNARFIVNPQVSITVLGYANRNVTVLGQVQRPGAFSLKDQASVDLLRAIGMAGGFTRLANASKVTVRRMEAGREVVRIVDAQRMSNDLSTHSFLVLPGDTITVAERLF